ncbi:MAG: DUF2062 domain-containing protein [Rubellimicrobium sp.]|nr:DUF2062 domain-containing protein [Rubellimicrobium sp.]
MVFRRREKLSWWRMAIEGVWPRAGWPRVIRYFAHRIRRLPDSPQKVARGMFAGTFVSMLPLPGLQLVLGGLLAWAMRGNILAALLCAFISNPVTTPFIAIASITIGQYLLGVDTVLSAAMVANAFAEAGSDLWDNAIAPFTGGAVSWIGLAKFWDTVFLPYFIGSLVIGLASAVVAYYATIPLVRAYQLGRARRIAERAARTPAMGGTAGPTQGPGPSSGEDSE